MDASNITAIVCGALMIYGLVSLVLDIRRGVLALCRGIASTITTSANTLAYHWRAWRNAREKRREARSERVQASLAHAQREMAETLSYMRDQHARLQEQLDAHSKPQATPTAKPNPARDESTPKIRGDAAMLELALAGDRVSRRA